MYKEILVGFNIHPRWIDGTSLHDFIGPLRQSGLGALEFELDQHLDRWEEFEPLMEETVQEGLALSFHAPYRLPYTLVGYSTTNRGVIENMYRPMLKIAEKWAIQTGNPRVAVFHAATAPTPHSSDLLAADTVAFLQWVCEEFPHIRVALENNNPISKNIVKLGIAHKDVIHLVNSINHPHLGICWDMGHDAVSKIPVELTPEWLSKVIHVHIHDVDENGLDHYPLVLGNIPYQDWLTKLKQASMQGIVVLELKGERMKNWSLDRVMSALTDSFSTISKEVA